MADLISILLPVYNGEKYLSSAIKSVISQTCKNWELLIIDDHSNDKTPSIAKKFAKKDKRIRYIRNGKNLRLAKTLNKGLKIAKGKYIARIDDDDIWFNKEKLERQLKYLKRNTDTVLIGTNYTTTNIKGTELNEVNLPLSDSEIRKSIFAFNPFGHSGVMYIKENAIRVGCYDENIKYGEDWDMWARLGLTGKMANLSINGFSYLIKPDSMSQQKTKRQQIRLHNHILKTYLTKYPCKLKGLYALFRYIVFYTQPNSTTPPQQACRKS